MLNSPPVSRDKNSESAVRDLPAATTEGADFFTCPACQGQVNAHDGADLLLHHTHIICPWTCSQPRGRNE
jgi:hypothetical protein